LGVKFNRPDPRSNAVETAVLWVEDTTRSSHEGTGRSVVPVPGRRVRGVASTLASGSSRHV